MFPRLLEQRERVAAELQRVPEDPLSARHQGDVTRDLSVSYGHVALLTASADGYPQA